MNPQLLLVFSPFLAVLYILFALIQALRGKRQGTFAAILAFLAAALSMVAFVVTSEALARAQLERLMLLNAIIAFVASLLILLIERRRKDRDPSRSYGIIGVGLAILLALGTYITPLLANAVPASSNTALNRGDTTLQTISALTPGAPTTDLASVLSAQTGLSATDLTTQLTAGSSIAQLVSAHNGNLQTVTAAVKSSLDTMVASGSRAAQFLTRLGSDTSAIADQIVQGQLPAQAQGRVIQLLTTSGSGGQGTFQPQANGTPNPQFNGSGNGSGSGSGNGSNGGNGGGFQPPALATEQAAPQAIPTIAAPASGGSDLVADVLSAQTGLSAADLTTQITAGSTIAQLVSAHNGDVSAVSAAIKTALDNLTAAGGRAAGMISRLGTDTATVADQIVQGQLPAQQQQFVVSFLMTGALPQFGGANNGGANNAGGSGGGNGGFQPQATPNAPANQSVSANNANPPANGSGAPSSDNAAAPVDPPPAQPTATPAPVTPPPTSSIERPTRIVFPTSTPTPEAAAATEETNAAATDEAAPSTASGSTTVGASGTCTLVTNFNLNLRDKPGKDGIVLLSIPMGTTVTSDARTADGWFSVSYDGHDGWVSGQYAGQSAGCASLPTK